MKYKLIAIILFIGVFTFGVYNVKVQSCAPVVKSSQSSDRIQVDKVTKNNYEEIIKDNEFIFEKDVEILKDSKEWFVETLDLLNSEDLESIMFLYSKGVEQDISNLVYDISLYSDPKHKEISNDLELNWDSFCDNFEYAYFNKSQNAEYKKYIDKTIKSMNDVIKIIDSI